MLHFLVVFATPLDQNLETQIMAMVILKCWILCKCKSLPMDLSSKMQKSRGCVFNYWMLWHTIEHGLCERSCLCVSQSVSVCVSVFVYLCVCM